MKQHSERFTNAVTKLYNAFHKGKLNPDSPCACAVGNLCDGNSKWNVLVKDYGSGELETNFFCESDKKLGILAISKTGYSPLEIVTIEKIFLEATDWVDFDYVVTQEKNYNGLCAVVEYLCELEGIPNIMDYTCLFETENNEPKHSLEKVF